MADKLRVGIIGVGGIANGKHMPEYSKMDNVEMVAFCDLIEERARKGAAQYGVPGAKVFTDYRDLLDLKDVDAVSVCTPNDAHSFITIDALKAGKHVLCEKPMAKTSKEAAEMLKTAKETGKKLSIGYQNRFRPETMYLKKLIEEGELGDIYYARAIALRRRGVPTWGSFLSMEKQGGGPLIDIATHALDMTLWLMDNYKPVSVTGKAFYKLGKIKEQQANSWGTWDPETFEVEDSAFGFVKFDNGAVVSVESSWAINMVTKGESDNSCILCGTKAGAQVLDGLSLNGVRNQRLYEWKPELRPNDRSYDEIKEWVDHVMYDGPLTVLPEQALVVSQVLEAIYESSKTGKEILL